MLYPTLTPEAALLGLTAHERSLKNAILPEELKEALKMAIAQRSLMEQQSKYYGPKTQAEIDLHNAQIPLTQQQARLIGEQAKYYAPNAESEIDLRRAQIPLTQQNAIYKQMVNKNPLLAQTGPAGQIGAMLQLQQMQSQNGQTNMQQAQGLPEQQGSGRTVADMLSQVREIFADKQPPQVSANRGPATVIENKKSDVSPRKLATMGDFMRSMGIDSPGSQVIASALDADTNRKQAVADYLNKRATGYSFTSAPPEVKRDIIAQLKGANIEPGDAIEQLVREGKTMGQILQENNVKDVPAKEYLPTIANITELKKREAYQSELNVIDKAIAEGLSPYAKTIKGYSPKQITDALTGSNIDQQVKFFIARAVMPETVAIRVRMAGGQTGIEAIREMTEKAMGNINDIPALRNPEIFKKTQEGITDLLQRTADEAVKSFKSNARSSSPAQEDLEYTAKKYGMTVDQLKSYLGSR